MITPVSVATPSQNSTLPFAAVAAKLCDLPEVRDGVDDQRGEHSLGQVLEQRREEQHGDEDQHGREEWGELGAGARLLVDGRLGKAAPGGQSTEQPGAGVGDPEHDQLLVGVDVVAVLGREVLSRAERFAEDDQQHAGGGSQQRLDVAALDAGNGRGWQPAGHVPDDLDSMLRQVEDRADDDPEDQGQQPARDARNQAIDCE